ncbi:MAG: condensation domain-containing protein [Candidatus Heimdallarchaeota archaeon]
MHSGTSSFTRLDEQDNVHTIEIPKRFATSANDELNYLLRNGTDQQINFVFHLDGQIDINIMKKTVRMILDAEPVLGCRYVKHKNRTYWERREDIDEVDYFEVIKTNNHEKEIKKFVLKDIDPVVDPLLKVRLYRGKEESLVIKSDHSVMDGGGFYHFFSLFVSIYNNLLENPDFQVKPNINASRDLKQVLKYYKFRRKFLSLVGEEGIRSTWSFPSIGAGREIRNYSIRRYDRERFLSIKQYGKEHNATITDVLVTAFFRALFKINNTKTRKRMTVAIPTDLRALLPNKKSESIANLVSATFATIKYYPEDSFDKHLKDINKQMKRKREIHLGLGNMYAIRHLFKMRYSFLERITRRLYKRMVRKKKNHPILTNVGILDCEQRNFGSVNVIDGYNITPVNWAPSFSMGMSSFNKKLTLTIGFAEDSYDPETIEYFLDLVDKELPK